MTASGISGFSTPSRKENYVKVPDMRTVKESFRSQLALKEDDPNPKLDEILTYLTTVFQKATQDPSLIDGFHRLWERIKNSPRDEKGHIQISEDIGSEITLDKISKW